MKDKKKLVEWLNNPITERYYESLLDHKKDLKERLFDLSVNKFCGNGINQRSEEEISAHTRLIAVDMVLNDLQPLFEFKAFCNRENLEMEDVGETYKEITGLEEIEHENPLTNFINNLYK